MEQAMPQSQDANILYSQDGAVFTMQINRPDKKNALLPGMYKALGDGIYEANTDDSINVILIRGTEDCFTSGNDVNGFLGDTGGERPSVHFMKALATAKKPIIAAVGGLAIGIGTTLLFHCDLIYASEESYLHLPFTRLGACPEAGSSYLLPKQIGHARASELLLLSERFSAQKAQEYGIVNEVLPQNEYLQRAADKAQELASLPAQSVQTSKALLKRGQEEPLLNTIELELERFSALMQTPEAQAIIAAFLNKKKA